MLRIFSCCYKRKGLGVPEYHALSRSQVASVEMYCTKLLLLTYLYGMVKPCHVGDCSINCILFIVLTIA